MEESQINTIRLNKAISDTGFCSRREADKIIEEGRVLLNGKVAVLGDRVNSIDTIEIDGNCLHRSSKLVYIAFNKPVGITCTTELDVEGNIINYINHPERIFPIGRLDKPSEGLIFLTNDGDIVNKILRAGNNHEKEYAVMVNKPITEEFISRMSNGIPILDTMTQKCFVEQESEFVFRITLTQGLNRQIRRMCDYLGYKVYRLKRLRIMNVTLEGIAPGKWRDWSAKELVQIQKLVAESIKTEEASLGLNSSTEDTVE
jgi:23S rRNA pseudouridine2604 synthase